MNLILTILLLPMYSVLADLDIPNDTPTWKIMSVYDMRDCFNKCETVRDSLKLPTDTCEKFCKKKEPLLTPVELENLQKQLTEVVPNLDINNLPTTPNGIQLNSNPDTTPNPGLTTPNVPGANPTPETPNGTGGDGTSPVPTPEVNPTPANPNQGSNNSNTPTSPILTTAIVLTFLLTTTKWI